MTGTDYKGYLLPGQSSQPRHELLELFSEQEELVRGLDLFNAACTGFGVFILWLRGQMAAGLAKRPDTELFGITIPKTTLSGVGVNLKEAACRCGELCDLWISTEDFMIRFAFDGSTARCYYFAGYLTRAADLMNAMSTAVSQKTADIAVESFPSCLVCPAFSLPR